MSTSSFNLLARVQDIEIGPNAVTGGNDGLRAYLNVGIKFTFRPLINNEPFEILLMEAQLKPRNQDTVLAETQMPLGITVRYWPRNLNQANPPIQELNTAYDFKFFINEKANKIIEKNRQGDVYFNIKLTALILVKNAKQVPAVGVTYSAEQSIVTSANIELQIPRSIWVEKIMPDLGFQNLKLIEIPLSHKNLKEAYADIIFEFNKAEGYFNNQDYDQCVAHCRATMDALSRNLIKIKKGVESETAFNWLKVIDTATLAWIDELNKANSAIASKPHHAGHKKEFSREEAESIYLVVLGLLNFVGHTYTQYQK